MKAWLHSAHSFFFDPIEENRLTLWVRWFSISFILYISARLEYAREWLTDFGFHFTPQTLYSPHLVFMPTLPEWSVPYFISGFYIVCFSFLLLPRNFFLRWAMFSFALYVQGVDVLSAFTLNKIYIISYFVYALPVSRPEQGKLCAWPLRILQMTLLLMYFTAGSCKVIHGNWLQHPDALWTQVQGLYRTDITIWLLQALPKWAWQVQMNLALSFELLAPILFCVRSFRRVGILTGIGFHLVIALTMHELIYFSFQMICFYLLFPIRRQ